MPRPSTRHLWSCCQQRVNSLDPRLPYRGKITRDVGQRREAPLIREHPVERERKGRTDPEDEERNDKMKASPLHVVELLGHKAGGHNVYQLGEGGADRVGAGDQERAEVAWRVERG